MPRDVLRQMGALGMFRLRDARANTIGGGATEVMLEEVAKRSRVRQTRWPRGARSSPSVSQQRGRRDAESRELRTGPL